MAIVTSALFSSSVLLSAVNSRDIKEYAIAVLLPSEAAEKAAEMNRQVAGQLQGFVNPQNKWHVTLYHLACDEEALSEIVDQLHGLKIEPIRLSFSELYSTADRWIDWGMNHTESLCLLHKRVVEIASKYSKRPLKRASDIYDSLPAEKRAQVDKYGVSGVLEFYNPHTTLFYYEFDKNGLKGDHSLQNAVMSLAQINGNAETSCEASSIIIGELGYNGNITKILYEIPMSSACS